MGHNAQCPGEGTEIGEQLCAYDAGVDRHRFDLRESSRQFSGVKNVRELALAVASVDEVILGCAQVLEYYTASGVESETLRGHADYAYVGIGRFRSAEKSREKEFDEQCMRDVVDAKMDFISFFSEGRRNVHDPGTAYDDVQTFRFGDDLCCRLFDRGQGGKVAFEEYNCDRWSSRLDIGDDFCRSFRVASAEVYPLRVVFREC